MFAIYIFLWNISLVKILSFRNIESERMKLCASCKLRICYPDTLPLGSSKTGESITDFSFVAKNFCIKNDAIGDYVHGKL